MRSRRSPRPATWLGVVETATAAFTGTAHVLSDTPAQAGETTLRGAGYMLAAEIAPDRAIFGPRPDAAVTLRGETARPPERRQEPGGPRFPPDSLRDVPYWDQACPGADPPVLCVLSDPPVLRALLGPDDDLPGAVGIIRGWVEQGTDVRKSLPGAPAVCYVAGFELLLRTTTDLPGLVERILRIPGRPGAAARGILQLLNVRTGRLPDADVAALARKLLAVLADERDPEALVAYLTWFDAHRQRATGLDKDLRAEAERVVTLRFDGPDGAAWQQEVARFAAPLTGHAS